MVYGYARVSSQGQSLYGTSLDLQEAELLKAGADVVYKDVFTGMTAQRPQLEKLLSVLTEGDTLIVKKMDRLGRGAEDIIHLIKTLVSKGIKVNILNMGVADNTMMGRFMVTILAGIAEFEHDMILERLNEGKAVKRAQDKNYKEGRKSKPFDVGRYKDLQAKVDTGEITICEASAALGVSRAKWYRIKETQS